MASDRITRAMAGTLKDDMEQFIDRESLDALLYLVQEICLEKAEHIRSNWQDEALAKEWEYHVDSIEVTRTEFTL